MRRGSSSKKYSQRLLGNLIIDRKTQMDEPSSSSDDRGKMEERLLNEEDNEEDNEERRRKEQMDELLSRSEDRGEIVVRLLNEENRGGRLLNAGYNEERLQNEEYRIWRNNAVFLYDLVLTHELDWPSLTVQWLPDRQEPAGKEYSCQTLIVGTHTADPDPNFLKLVEVRLPLMIEAEINARGWSDEVGGFGTIGSANGKVKDIQKITHNGDVHRARYMPQNIFLIATKTASSEVYIFDSTKHPFFEVHPNPDIRLHGHSEEGYALAWNKLKEGHLLSGSHDSRICLWDINANTHSNRTINAMQTFETHHNLVEDVAWHLNPELFGSVGEDHQLLLWDARRSAAEGPCTRAIEAHPASVNCLAFNPFNENMLATGSQDGTVAVFDLRKFNKRLHTLVSEHAKGDVVHVEWSPSKQNILASGGDDRRVRVWDISNIGQNESEGEETLPPELKKQLEAEKGDPPKLRFIHSGHTGEISDFSWNPSEDLMIASVEQGNLLEVWQMRESQFVEEEYGIVDDMTSLRIQSKTGPVDDMTSLRIQSETGPVDEMTCGFNSYEPDL